ncbi:MULTISPECIES: glycerophosphodiester phosphodiesterase [Halomicrobium]|uniref:Glycerophosphoryl diester phosphodiesterase n=1 Tax=Halomicrobium mukohataei (strain ATCC 700874 / DSM 12286 / JCM 9738 / NCIMB 13541) TaxID=485914 RepID=C7NXM7_HALMD|nr:MULTISPECIES: glycerophosphodiester phosphodiesterase [Halomicrobium]ACV46465.1 glycerophosphoryl diester phosphodiesterase [Halomicrobium mukohataei DSM 12286]
MWPTFANGAPCADAPAASLTAGWHDGASPARPLSLPVGRRGLVRSGLGGLATLLAGCTGGSGHGTETASRTREDDVRLIGHRGCADQYPENTIFAVEQSAPHVDMIEFDVQRCGSGELVVFHDDELDRLTDATGPVATTDWEELRELTILDSEETIPRLSAFLSAVPSDTAVNIELKHDGMAAEVVSAADECDNEVLFSSFSPDALREVRERDDAAALAFLVSDAPERSLSFADEMDCVAVNPGVDLVLDTDFVERAHAEGFEVNTWTVDDSKTARRLVDAGVDGLFVDRWDLLTE